MVMMILLGMFFFMSMQPIMMIVIMMLITLLYSLLMYQIMESFWFGYLLIMIMLSGVLVVFTYVVSLMPNESFEVYNLICIMGLFIIIFEKSFLIYKMDNSFVSLYLYGFYIGMLNVFLVSFLFMIMLMVVWISYIKEGSVRI